MMTIFSLTLSDKVSPQFMKLYFYIVDIVELFFIHQQFISTSFSTDLFYIVLTSEGVYETVINPRPHIRQIYLYSENIIEK